MMMTLLTFLLMYAFFYLPIPTLLLSFLQVYLCRRNLRRGLILPIVSAVLGSVAAPVVGLLLFPYLFGMGNVSYFLLTLAALARLSRVVTQDCLMPRSLPISRVVYPSK